MARASAPQLVDLGFISPVESYQQTLKNGIYSFLAWRSTQKRWHGEQAGKLACCVLGKSFDGMPLSLCGKQVVNELKEEKGAAKLS